MTTLGAPFGGVGKAGHSAVDSPYVGPIFPPNGGTGMGSLLRSTGLLIIGA